MSKSDILQTEIAKDFRKGLLKFFILKMLDREDMHGYAMMTRIEEICGWKVSPGSLYPTLFNLHTQGLVKAKVVEMRKMFSLTTKGKNYITQINNNFDTGLNEISRIFKEL
jgi:DNA-binding PadR family transcriptional regulator